MPDDLSAFEKQVIARLDKIGGILLLIRSTLLWIFLLLTLPIGIAVLIFVLRLLHL